MRNKNTVVLEAYLDKDKKSETSDQFSRQSNENVIDYEEIVQSSKQQLSVNTSKLS
jgi:hypothetical protein